MSLFNGCPPCWPGRPWPCTSSGSPPSSCWGPGDQAHGVRPDHAPDPGDPGGLLCAAARAVDGSCPRAKDWMETFRRGAGADPGPVQVCTLRYCWCLRDYWGVRSRVMRSSQWVRGPGDRRGRPVAVAARPGTWLGTRSDMAGGRRGGAPMSELTSEWRGLT